MRLLVSDENLATLHHFADFGLYDLELTYSYLNIYIYICIHLQAFELGYDRRHSIWLRTILSPFEGFSAKLLMPVTWLIGDASRVSVEMFQGCKKLDTCSRHLLFTKTYDRL